MVTPRSQADAIDHVGENGASVSIGDVNIVVRKFASHSPEPDCEGTLGEEPSNNITKFSSYADLEERLQDYYSDLVEMIWRLEMSHQQTQDATPASESTTNYHYVVWAREFHPNRTRRIRTFGIHGDVVSANAELMDYVCTKHRSPDSLPCQREISMNDHTLYGGKSKHMDSCI
ncbi:hypothetical protein SCAR479_13135 [Seiridium cardinale]|uniref:Uncharacterized protein n=1 Tax=Seiridium cardinale TaxID=138064 RepID=A0ABR2X8X1_9PEZI